MANKIALVTGASRGLGKDMALALAKSGIDVILTYHTKKEEAEQVASTIVKTGGKATVLQLDVSNTASFDGFLQKVKTCLKDIWGTDSFDFLINNAGTGATLSIAEVTEAFLTTWLIFTTKALIFLRRKACL